MIIPPMQDDDWTGDGAHDLPELPDASQHALTQPTLPPLPPFPVFVETVCGVRVEFGRN